MPETNSTQIIDDYIEQLIASRGGAAMNAEEQAQLRADLRVRLEDRVAKAMFDALPDAKLIELEQLLDMGAADEVLEEFFAEAGADYSEAVKQAVEEFGREYGEMERSAA